MECYLIGFFLKLLSLDVPDFLGTYAELMQNDFAQMVLCKFSYKNMKR